MESPVNPGAVHYRSRACEGCGLKPQCTPSRWRSIRRGFFEAQVERMRNGPWLDLSSFVHGLLGGVGEVGGDGAVLGTTHLRIGPCAARIVTFRRNFKFVA